MRMELPPRRVPLGVLPPSRPGTRNTWIGIRALRLGESGIAPYIALAPDSVNQYLIRTASAKGTGWAIRIHGDLPAEVEGSQIVQKLRGNRAFKASQFYQRPLLSFLESRDYLAFPQKLASTRDYLFVNSYTADVLPLSSLRIVDADAGLTFGWVSSKAFWLWSQVVAANTKAANMRDVYNSFPAPALSRKEKSQLEAAATTVLASRGFHLKGSLTELYGQVPEALLWSHEQLDQCVNTLLGLPGNSSDKQVIDNLLQRYSDLV